MTTEFKIYQLQVVANCKILSEALKELGYKIVTGTLMPKVLGWPLLGGNIEVLPISSSSQGVVYHHCNDFCHLRQLSIPSAVGPSLLCALVATTWHPIWGLCTVWEDSLERYQVIAVTHLEVAEPSFFHLVIAHTIHAPGHSRLYLILSSIGYKIWFS